MDRLIKRRCFLHLSEGRWLSSGIVLLDGLESMNSNSSSVSHDETVHPADGYAGDVSPSLAWSWVQSGHATLVDVRTDAEREWVGQVPGAQPLAWKQWPGMAMNPEFESGIQALGANGQPLVLLCRSGVRSIAAAVRATELGVKAYNILEGFEGNPDTQAHRGQTGGWKFRGLPWRQN
jgi:rhodanese-related sulfurtransferase